MLKYVAYSALLIGSQLLSAHALATEQPETSDISAAQESQLPLHELRNFTEIFDRIRSSYVEPVD